MKETAISVAVVEVTFAAKLTLAQTTNLEKLVADEVVLADPSLNDGDVICVVMKKATGRRRLLAVSYDVDVRASPTKAAVLKEQNTITVAKLDAVASAAKTKSADKIGVAITFTAAKVVEIIIPTAAPSAAASPGAASPTKVVFSAAGSVAPYLVTAITAVAAPFFLSL